jgi:hypothetical protein
MIGEDVRAKIRRLYFAEHWKVGTIAAELGLHRDTVAGAVDTSRFSNCRFRGQALILDPYRDFIRATLEQYPLRCGRHSRRAALPKAQPWHPPSTRSSRNVRDAIARKWQERNLGG